VSVEELQDSLFGDLPANDSSRRAAGSRWFCGGAGTRSNLALVQGMLFRAEPL